MVNLTVVNADCRNMAELSPNSVDLAVTSPPYYNAKVYSGAEMDIGKQQPYNGYLNDMRNVMTEVHRVLKRGHVFALNISNHIYEGKRFYLPYDLLQVSRDVGFTMIDNILWVKPLAAGGKRGGIVVQMPYSGYYRPNLVAEFIFILCKGPAMLIHEGYHSQAEKDSSRIPDDMLKASMTEVWRMAPDSHTPHPAPYPEELPRRVIIFYCLRGGLVLDPFLGSGTTMLVARNLGRHCIGYELNPDYIPLIQEKVGWGMSLTDKFELIDATDRKPRLASPLPSEVGPRVGGMDLPFPDAQASPDEPISQVGAVGGVDTFPCRDSIASPPAPAPSNLLLRSNGGVSPVPSRSDGSDIPDVWTTPLDDEEALADFELSPDGLPSRRDGSDIPASPDFWAESSPVPSPEQQVGVSGVVPGVKVVEPPKEDYDHQVYLGPDELRAAEASLKLPSRSDGLTSPEEISDEDIAELGKEIDDAGGTEEYFHKVLDAAVAKREAGKEVAASEASGGDVPVAAASVADVKSPKFDPESLFR